MCNESLEVPPHTEREEYIPDLTGLKEMENELCGDKKKRKSEVERARDR